MVKCTVLFWFGAVLGSAQVLFLILCVGITPVMLWGPCLTAYKEIIFPAGLLLWPYNVWVLYHAAWISKALLSVMG